LEAYIRYTLANPSILQYISYIYSHIWVFAVKKVESSELVEAGLAAMKAAGKPLTRQPSKGRAMIYAMPNGDTVRLRTCNDHVLIVVGDRPTPDAKLNIEGTDWILMAMPQVERKPGNVDCYLLPTAEVEAEARRTHMEWLAGNPKTGGDNKTWNLWFKEDGPGKANDYARKWQQYKLAPTPIVEATPRAGENNAPGTGNVKAEVESARRRIAEAAGVPVESVKITINFEG